MDQYLKHMIKPWFTSFSGLRICTRYQIHTKVPENSEVSEKSGNPGDMAVSSHNTLFGLCPATLLTSILWTADAGLKEQQQLVFVLDVSSREWAKLNNDFVGLSSWKFEDLRSEPGQ